MIENQQMVTCGFLGEQQVGKTSLIHKFFHKTQLQTYTPTIAVEIYYSCFESEEGTIVKVKCWDTSGQNKYKGMVCYHMKSVDIGVIMFDLTNLASFAKVNEWVERMKSQKVTPKVLYLVGNKADLVRLDVNLRKIPRRQGQKKAKQISARYAEISVNSDEGLQFMNEAFQDVLSLRATEKIQRKRKQHNLGIQTTKIIEKNSSDAPCQCLIF